MMQEELTIGGFTAPGAAGGQQEVVSAIRQIKPTTPSVSVKVFLDGDELTAKLERSTDDRPGGDDAESFW
jgi:hypothetical protein